MFRRISIHCKQLRASRFANTSVLVALVLATAVLAGAKNHVVPSPHGGRVAPATASALASESPRIEVVFVLDTTGSMSGLLAGAKQKIWSIVNQMAAANTTPDIAMGLIGYRDRGDEYVTKRFALTEDIDALYGNLQGLSAGGGGDGPESVNQALNEAITQMNWSQDQGVYKVVFLVGDAPPHMDYRDDVPYPTSIEAAAKRGIVINTIQCGSGPEAARVFAGIARLAQGEFASISQDGDMVASHTPMDEELNALNLALSETVVAYGARSDKDALLGKIERSLTAAPAAVASRLSYLAKKGGAATSGRGDLIDALGSNEVDLNEVPEAELPTVMQSMDLAERNSYLGEKKRERDEIKAKIAELVKSRDSYVEQETRAREKEGKADAFDDRLLDTLRSQAAEKGILY